MAYDAETHSIRNGLTSAKYAEELILNYETNELRLAILCLSIPTRLMQMSLKLC